MRLHGGAATAAFASATMIVALPTSREGMRAEIVPDSTARAASAAVRAPNAEERRAPSRHAAHGATHREGRDAVATVGGQLTLLGATGAEGGRVTDAVVYLEPLALPAPPRAAAPAPAAAVAPAAPRDSVRLLWGAMRELSALVRDVRGAVAELRAGPSGARVTPRPGARAPGEIADVPTPTLASLDELERAQRAAAAPPPRPPAASPTTDLATLLAPTPTREAMAMRQKEFLPHVVVVPVGSAVEWPNRDPFSHNVFSNTPGGAFDLGLYPRGESRGAPFRRPGVYEIFCNIHSRMSAFVVAVPTALWAQPGADGRFSIANVPAGRYRLRAWHERGGEQSQVVTVDADGVRGVRLALDARAYRPKGHANKFGQPYPRATRDDY